MKKNDKVYMIQVANREGFVWIKEMIIDSYGKKQAHFRYTHNETMAGERFGAEWLEDPKTDTTIYPHEIGKEAIEKIAMETSAKSIARWLEQHENRLATNLDPEYEYYDGPDTWYVKDARKDVETLKNAKPHFKYYVDWCKEMGYNH